MSKIGILAGGGDLPLIIGNSLYNYNENIIFFCIEPFAKKNKYKNFETHTINLKSLSKILYSLKTNKITSIIMAGYVERPSLKDILFDYESIKLIKKYALESKGDDNLLKIIQTFF